MSRSQEFLKGPDMTQQQIRFTTSADGTRVAYAVSGKGKSLVKAANWLTHVEYEWESPVWAHWMQFLSEGRKLIRYDERGTGLSERDIADASFERMVEDLEAVVTATGADKFDLLGISQGAPIAIEYAARHPEKVDRLVLYGGYAQGWKFRETAQAKRRKAAEIELARLGWGSESAVYRDLFASIYIPGGTEEQKESFSEMCRRSATPETAGKLLTAFGDIDVTGRLASLDLPALVLHPREDGAVPFSQGQLLASSIPGARFVPLDSRCHILPAHDPAWSVATTAIAEFLAEQGAPFGDLTSREQSVLALLSEGRSNAEIAEGLGLSEKTVRNYLSVIFEKLGVSSRAQAIVLARDRGLAG